MKNDDPQLSCHAVFIPMSGTYKYMRLSELQSHGYQMLHADQMIDFLEKKNQNIECCHRANVHRATIYLCSYIPVVFYVYILKFLKMAHMAKAYNKWLMSAKWIFSIITPLLLIGLYQLNKYNVLQQDDPVYRKIGRTQLYFDPKKLVRCVFGFIMPCVLFVLHATWFVMSKGDLGIWYFVAVISEFTVMWAFSFVK